MQTLPHPPAPSQKKFTTTHTHPHQAKKGHTHSCLLTRSQKKDHTPPKKVTPTHIQPKKVIPTHICPHAAKKWSYPPIPAVNLWKRKLSISWSNLSETREVLNIIFTKYHVRQLVFQFQHGIGQMTNNLAAVRNNFRQITYYLCAIFHAFTSLLLTAFCFFSYCVHYVVLFFGVTCTSFWTVHNMLDDLTQKK